MTPNLRIGSATDIGHSRSTQEDDLLISPPLFAVADGMGGHTAGDVASKTALEVLGQQMRVETDLVGAVRMANAAVFEKASAKPDLAGMGTTVTALLAKDGSVQIAHVGDSRAYLFRDGELRRLTTDHTVVERMVRQGRIRPEDAHGHPQRSILERALGLEPEVDIDVEVVETAPGDRIILCTDGLSGMITEEDIERIVASEADPEKLSRRLVQEALEYGGHDNVSVIVIDLSGQPGKSGKASPSPRPEPRRGARRRGWLWALVAAVLVLVVGLLAAKASLDRSWYVGESSGRVAVFKGVPGSVIGIDLSEVESTTDVEVGSLPAIYEQRLRDGIRVEDRQEALHTVENLRRLAASGEEQGSGP